MKSALKNKILFAASECAPFAKVGGLADVIGSLPKALKKIGADVSVILPFYGKIKIEKEKTKVLKEKLSIFFDGEKRFFNLHQSFLENSNVPLILVESEKYFEGDIYLTEDASSEGSEKEAERFFFFSKVAIKTAEILNFSIIHCHDWHTGIIPFLAKKNNLKFKTILTIHNLGYQGIYDSKIANRFLGSEFQNDINCLRIALSGADIITTVSPNYAKEILTPEFGFGLEEKIKKRKKDLFGIINGIDEEQFSPKEDSYIAQKYSEKKLDLKKENKKFLQKEYFKKVDLSVPIIGVISRLAEQKGFDLIRDSFERLMKKNIQLIILGKGMKEFEDFFQSKNKEYPGKFFAKIGFDENLAHQIYAGADMFLIPSHFEPCGLGQLIAMKYGTIPIARAVGGLKDTIEHKKTGFLFEKPESQELLNAIKDSLSFYRKEKIWKKIQTEGMKQDFSWQNSAQKYLEIYRDLTRV